LLWWKTIHASNHKFQISFHKGCSGQFKTVKVTLQQKNKKT
jgi:hypothetical protein